MKVSVITPTYNRADVLPRAAESVFRQDYDNLEYVIVDDASEDETAAVVEEFDFEPLVFEEHETNKGNAGARNTGVEVATGDLIVFLDSDDELTDGAISELVRTFNEAPDTCGCVMGDYELRYSDGRIDRRRFRNKITYQDFLDGEFFVEFTGKLYPKFVFDEIGPFDERLRAGVDTDFHIRLTKAGYHMQSIGDVVATRHYENDNVSSNFEAVAEAEHIIQAKHGDDFPDQKTAARWARVGRLAADEKRMSAARQYFKRSWLTHPTSLLYLYYLLIATTGTRGYDLGFRIKERGKSALRSSA